MKKQISIFVISVTLALSLMGCNESSISPPIDTTYHFDSARYNWTIYSFNSSLLTFDSFNDSDIFLLSAGSLIVFDGNSFANLNFNYDGLYALSMGGYNKNNIYIGGNDNTVANKGMPRLKKWNGSLFEEIYIPDSTNRPYQISTIFPKSDNEIWIGSTRGDLISYVNGNFQFVRLDSTFAFLFFGTDDLQNEYAVASKTVFDSSTIRYLNIYKKSNSSWEWTEIFSEKYVNYDPNEILPSLMKTSIIGFQNNNIKKFSGNTFVDIFNIEPFDAYPVSQLSDSSINFFLQPGVQQSMDGLKFFQWNGNKWSKELNLRDLNINAQFIPRTKRVINKYYFLAVDEVAGMSFLGKGKSTK